MKIYIDGIILLNFALDFIILMCINIVLRRNINIKRIILGSFIGSLTVLLLFIKINSTIFLFIKIFISILMILISFGYKDIKYLIKNLMYFYTISFILGGFIYYLNIKFSYKNIGMIFFYEGLSINYIFILFLSPIIILLYIKQAKELKYNYSLNYEVIIYYNNKTYNLRGYLDTANNVIEPYKKRLVIITNDKLFKKEIKDKPFLLVPIDTINESTLLKCIVPDKVYIENMGIFNNIVIGISNKKFNIEGINCILNAYLIKVIK